MIIIRKTKVGIVMTHPLFQATGVMKQEKKVHRASPPAKCKAKPLLQYFSTVKSEPNLIQTLFSITLDLTLHMHFLL